MRPCVPTYLELSVSQLAAFGAPRPHNLKSVTQREEGSRVFFRHTPFRLSCYSITAPFHLRALCYATLRDADSLCESGIHYGYNTFSLSQGLYHRLRHFRLIAGTEG